MLWIKNAYNWIKDNLLLVGAAIGSVITLVVSVLLSRDKSTELVLEHNKESDQQRREKDERAIEITEKFIEDMEIVREQAKIAGKELTDEQEEVLTERLDAFSSAETDEQKAKIAEDIQNVFPFLNMVDPSAFGKVE